MIFVLNKNLNTFFNMAAEEYFLDRYVEDVLILWQNKNTIVVGKNQNTLAEIDIDYVRENNIEVVRRLTGGGAMYQDIGNLNFTFICNNSGEWYSDFSKFTTPVVQALNKLGVPAELSGRNDIIVQGRKISGNAANLLCLYGSVIRQKQTGRIISLPCRFIFRYSYVKYYSPSRYLRLRYPGPSP